MFSVLVLGKSSGGTHQRGWRDRQEKGLNLLAVGCRCLAIRGWTPSQSQLSCSLPRHVPTQVWVRRRQRRWKDRQSISPARGQINLHSALYTRGRYRFARVRESSREFARVLESSRGFAKDTRIWIHNGYTAGSQIEVDSQTNSQWVHKGSYPKFTVIGGTLHSVPPSRAPHQLHTLLGSTYSTDSTCTNPGTNISGVSHTSIMYILPILEITELAAHIPGP